MVFGLYCVSGEGSFNVIKKGSSWWEVVVVARRRKKQVQVEKWNVWKTVHIMNGKNMLPVKAQISSTRQYLVTMLEIKETFDIHHSKILGESQNGMVDESLEISYQKRIKCKLFSSPAFAYVFLALNCFLHSACRVHTSLEGTEDAVWVGCIKFALSIEAQRPWRFFINRKLTLNRSLDQSEGIIRIWHSNLELSLNAQKKIV